MLATTISCAPGRNNGRRSYRSSCFPRITCPFFILRLLSLATLLLVTPVQPQTPPSEPRARHAFNAARARFDQAPSDLEAAWQLGRAAFDLANKSTDKDERKSTAELGADACRKAIAQAPDLAAAHYYLALNLSVLAQVKRFSALKLLHDMEDELLKAIQIDPKLDFAGPDRTVGMLYREAPPQPLSVGSRSDARKHLQAAVRLSPDYPENRICLAEAYAQWGEIKNLHTELSSLETLLPAARVQFDPAVWEADWKDWDERLGKLRKTRDRLQTSPKSSSSERGARTAR